MGNSPKRSNKVEVKKDYFTKLFYISQKQKKILKEEKNEKEAIKLVEIEKEKEIEEEKERLENEKMIEEYQNRTGPLGYFDEMGNEPIEIGPQATAEEIEEETGMVIEEDNNNDNNEEDDEDKEDKEKEGDNKEETVKDNDKTNKDIEHNENKDDTVKQLNDNANPNEALIKEDKDKDKDIEPNKKIINEDKAPDDKPKENPTEDKSKPNKEKKKRKKRVKPPIPLCLEDKESELPKDEHKELSIVVIGDHKCGKTSLILRYTEDIFKPKTKPTKKIIETKTKIANIEGKNIPIKLIDTPPIPNNAYTQIVQAQISKAHIVLYLFDLGEEDPLFKIKINCFNYTLKSKTLKVIVGNKLDQQTSYSDENKKAIEAYCREKDYLWDFISCAKFTQELFDKWFNMKVIPEYFIRKNEYDDQKAVNQEEVIGNDDNDNEQNKANEEELSKDKVKVKEEDKEMGDNQEDANDISQANEEAKE